MQARSVNRVSSSRKTPVAGLSRCCAVWLAILALIAAPGGVRAQSSDDSGKPSIAAQPGDSPPSADIGGQHGDDRTLEIAPQTVPLPPDSGVEELPSDKAYAPRRDTTLLDRNFNPGGNNSNGDKHRKLPYLGVSVQYTLKCYLGAEEHGLEIINVDPNSPAWRSGLNGRKSPSAVGAAAATASLMLAPLVMPLLARAGQLGTDGDLIVAVDDHRVRSQLDLEDELAKLKPGDTMYLTVIRPLPGGNHKTMKIAVKVGEPGETMAEAGSGAANSSPDAEQYAY